MKIVFINTNGTPSYLGGSIGMPNPKVEILEVCLFMTIASVTHLFYDVNPLTRVFGEFILNISLNTESYEEARFKLNNNNLHISTIAVRTLDSNEYALGVGDFDIIWLDYDSGKTFGILKLIVNLDLAIRKEDALYAASMQLMDMHIAMENKIILQKVNHEMINIDLHDFTLDWTCTN
ncbi:hypothetical protein [Brevibacillus brevis]|uniref:hypothetical protein n=1 Tax=Brevibacillus brevis TaxID=1393 RepID=UPI0007D8AB90|nr:hypothetical protein [Brevibacillus brevis]